MKKIYNFEIKIQKVKHINENFSKFCCINFTSILYELHIKTPNYQNSYRTKERLEKIFTSNILLVFKK